MPDGKQLDERRPDDAERKFRALFVERTLEFNAVANVLPGVNLSVLRDVTLRKRAEEDARRGFKCSAARINRLIRDLLDISSIESGCLALNVWSTTPENLLPRAASSSWAQRRARRRSPFASRCLASDKWRTVRDRADASLSSGQPIARCYS